MSQVISLRLPEKTARRLRESAQRTGHSVQEVGVRSIEEGLLQNEFPEIEFRAFYGGRRLACLKGALTVWEVIMVAKDHEMNVERTAAYFQWPDWKVEAAFDYYAAYPEEIDEMLDSHRSVTYEKLKQLLPEIGLYEVPEAVLTGEYQRLGEVG